MLPKHTSYLYSYLEVRGARIQPLPFSCWDMVHLQFVLCDTAQTAFINDIGGECLRARLGNSGFKMERGTAVAASVVSQLGLFAGLVLFNMWFSFMMIDCSRSTANISKAEV